MDYTTYTLKNNLKVIFVDTKTFPTLTTLLLVGSGSRYENDKNNGIAHFFEHMAFKGSKKYPNSFVISSTIEGMGGVFNAYTSKDHTGYWIKATRENITTVVDVLSDMILSPFLLEDEINREKGVIVEEINMYEDMPARKVSEYFDQLMYGGTVLGMDIAGTKETVTSFNRKTFTDYIDSLYRPSNAVLIVAGGLGDKDKVLKLIEKKFGNWQDKPVQPITHLTLAKQNGPRMKVVYKKTEQAHFCMGFPAFSDTDSRRMALTVLGAILGGGMSSRLFMEVRERRGLCYYISTWKDLFEDVGHVVTQAGVTNNLPKIKEAVSVALQQHKRIADGDLSEEDVTKAREYIKGRLLLSLEDSSRVASFFGDKQLLHKKIETPEEIIAEINAVTKADVINLAKELFRPELLNFALIGPYKESDFSAKDFLF